MSNVMQAICIVLTLLFLAPIFSYAPLLFLAPIFSYTPLVALTTTITSAMTGLLKYEEVFHLYKVDKGDFVICLAAFFDVAFLSMDYGLLMSVSMNKTLFALCPNRVKMCVCLLIGLAVVRALLYVARLTSCKLGAIPNSNLHQDVEHYPDKVTIPGIMVIEMGSSIYFASCTHLRERRSKNIAVGTVGACSYSYIAQSIKIKSRFSASTGTSSSVLYAMRNEQAATVPTATFFELPRIA